MGGGTGTQTQQTTTQLPPGQQRNVNALMGGAYDYYNTGGREYFPGETYAGYNPYQYEGQDALLNWARGDGQNFINNAISGNEFFMDPNNIMNPDNIPGYRDAQDATSRGYTRNLTENILPSVRGGGTNANQFGGSATGIGEALSVGRSNEGLADALARMDLGAYEMGLNSFNQAQNRAPELFALGTQPGQIIAGVGDARQGEEQRIINDEKARHDFGQNEEAYMLQLLQSLTGNAGQYGGTNTSNLTQSGGDSMGAQILGLALMAMGGLTANPGVAAAGTGVAGAGGGGKGGSTGRSAGPRF